MSIIRGCREFIALAEHLSFSRASAALHLSQPALSKHIALLEQEVGQPLFTRGNPIELTPAGVKFLEACVSMAQIYDSAIGEIRRLKSKPVHSLTVVGPLYIREIANLVSRCVTALRQDYELKSQLIAESPTPTWICCRPAWPTSASHRSPTPKCRTGSVP